MLGFINVSKPAKMTSHDVVAKLRKMTGLKQVGHAGTLDPAATGVLPIALGSACRLLRYLTNDKIYVAEILLGTCTTTDDLEGSVLSQLPVEDAIADSLADALSGFVGTQMQKPPTFSAVHHDGKRLYELARTGNAPVDVKARQVTVESIELLTVNLPVIQVRIKCSGGTYIRAIARDLGEKLGLGACLKSLIREQSGPFSLSESCSLEFLASLAVNDKLIEAIIAPQKVLDLGIVDVDRDMAKLVAMGQYLPIIPLSTESTREIKDDKLCLVTFEQSFLALCSVTEDGRLHPEVVVRNAESLA
jgi:tRNA pseudouridine55 synthase